MRHNLFVTLCMFYRGCLVTKVAQVIFFRSGAPLTEGRFLMYRGYQIRTYFWQIFLGFWPLWMGHSKLWWFQATIQSALLQWWQSAVNQCLFQNQFRSISCLQCDGVRWMVRESLVNVKMYKKTNEYENCKNKNSMFEYSIITN